MLWKAENFLFLCFGKQKMYCYLAIDDVELVNSFCLIAICLRFALFASFKIEKIYQSQNLE